jgi:hypothetical protein
VIASPPIANAMRFFIQGSLPSLHRRPGTGLPDGESIERLECASRQDSAAPSQPQHSVKA